MSIEAVNRELLVLADAFAEGRLGPGEYRQRRRELICGVTGQDVPDPEVPASAEGEGDQTRPGLAAVEAGPPDAGPAGGRACYWFLAGLLSLAAGGGIAGLVWFVSRP